VREPVGGVDVGWLAEQRTDAGSCRDQHERRGGPAD
jgi:hypothetical protein